MTRRLGLAVYIPLLSTTPVFAAKRGTADPKRHCAGYATTLCGDGDPDSKAMAACFENRKELSENCRRAIDAYRATGCK